MPDHVTRRPRVHVVLVTFRPAPAMLEDAVTAVLDHRPADLDVTVHVVDNGGEAEALLGAAGRGSTSLLEQVELTTSDDNVGFGAAISAGIRAARAQGAVDGDVIVVLNDDVVVSSHWLEPLVAEFDDPAVGTAQPLLVDPGGHRINSAGVEIDRFGAGNDRLRGEPPEAAGTGAVDIDVFTAGAVALSLAFVDDAGGFDDRFFLYYEDVELARRGTSMGWRHRFVPASVVEHRGSATTTGLGDELVFLRERNRLWSSAMHGTRSEVVAAIGLSLRRLRHAPRRVHARALLHGAVGAAVRIAARTVPRVVTRVRRSPERRRAHRVSGTPGVNLVGYHHISSGLGSNARELSAALRAAGIPVTEIDNDLSTSPRRRPARPVPDELHDTTIAIVTAFEFAHFVERFPQLVGPGKRMVAYWVWELDEVPPQHVDAARFVDEVWTPTTFVCDAYGAAVGERVQVRVAPFRMEEPVAPAASVAAWRRQWGTTVVFLVSFDYLSIVERKNPLGAIAAFRTAFDHTDDDVRLVVKSVNGSQRPDDLASVRAACGDDPRIQIVDEHLDDDAHHGLIAAADVLVSLHRSEGFGLHPAIAMWLGTPVVATRYSGVIDFLDDDCAALVDHRLVPVTNGQGIYPETSQWAEPDLAQAADHMRRLATDPHWRRRLARRGRNRIAGQPDAATFGEGYAALLRTPGSTMHDHADAFFDGIDAARSRAVTIARRWLSGWAWPDTVRRAGRGPSRPRARQ